MNSFPASLHAAAAGLALLLCSTAASAADADKAVRVQTLTYVEAAYYPVHSTAAEVIASNDSDISAEIAAKVEIIHHDTGERVDAGLLLVTLDCRSYRLQLQQARAADDASRAMYENAQQLYASAQILQKQNSISKELYNQRLADSKRLKAETQGTRAAVELAKIAVENCAIRAPYDAYIAARLVDAGELVQPGTALMRLISADPGPVEARIGTDKYRHFIDGADHRYVRGGREYPLKITSLLPVLDSDYRTHTARLAFTGEAAPTGSQGRLLWNDTARALPSNLVVKRDETYGVLVDEGGRVIFRPVGNYIEGHPAYIELDAGAAIITTGRFGLKPGDAVRSQ